MYKYKEKDTPTNISEIMPKFSEKCYCSLRGTCAIHTWVYCNSMLLTFI